MSNKLIDRINLYESSTDYIILPKIPLIFKINGKGFSNTTSLLDKPFDSDFSDCLMSTTKLLCSEIEGAVLSYTFNDTIIIIARNDQNNNAQTWFKNKITKLSSFTSSLAGIHFYKCADHISLSLQGYPVFTSHVFPVPNINEAINYLISCQQLNSLIAVQFSCYYELLKKYDKQHIKKTMHGLSNVERLDLLKDECGIDYETYNSIFRKGAVHLRSYDGKFKWDVLDNPPIFSTNQDFLKENMEI